MWDLVSPDEKSERNIQPFLTFPITKSCNFRCRYCGEGGEMSASRISAWSSTALLNTARIAVACGIEKIRLTGGEPLIHPEFETIAIGLSSLVSYLHVNSNGSLARRKSSILAALDPDVVHFAVSLDSLTESTCKSLSGGRAHLSEIKAGLETLAELDLLLRINMVVTTENIHEIASIIEYCGELGCDLKLLDVVSVPVPFDSRSDLHVSLLPVEAELSKLASHVEHHEYARSFGTPCLIYVVDGVRITVKNTWNGSRYDVNGICRGCEYFPCHEGLYDVFVLPDGRIAGCRWSGSSVIADPSVLEETRDSDSGSVGAGLTAISSIFQRADHVSREMNAAMRPYPEFVMGKD